MGRIGAGRESNQLIALLLYMGSGWYGWVLDVMWTAVALALIASFFTALASVAQRRAAAPAPGELSLSWRLILFLARRPVWFLGILFMIAGFLFQVSALRVGSLSLVQPLIATELLFVFIFVALDRRHNIAPRDWLAAIGMAVGLGLFLGIARPSGGTNHATGLMWALAGMSTFILAGILTLLAYVPLRRPPSSARKAALLAVAAATGFGFVAAVIKELSTHLSQGPYGVLTNWSPYALLAAGAVSFFLASNSFQAGSLAASQPGLTIMDPLVASALGVILFSEDINRSTLALTGEAFCLALVMVSVVLLSRSPLVHDASADVPAKTLEKFERAGTAQSSEDVQPPSVTHRAAEGRTAAPLRRYERRGGTSRSSGANSGDLNPEST